jgi:hypothetical protein
MATSADLTMPRADQPVPAAPLARASVTYRSQFCVGAVSVQLVTDRSDDAELGSSLEPFRVETSIPDIRIRIERVARLQPSRSPKLFDSGSIWRLYENEVGFQFDFNVPVVGDRPYKRLLVDKNFRQATIQTNEDCFAVFPPAKDPLGYPLDELLIMHRLTQERAIELHGVGIVGPDGTSNLFVGHSGAGKSTTARLWTSLHDVQILSDDRIILREDKLREDQRHENQRHENQLPASKPSVPGTQIFMYGTPWHGEAHYALPQRAPLQRIFVLEHGQGNALARLTRSQMVAELFARSFVPFHTHQYVDSALRFLERVADTVPCYRYSFEPDERAVERVLNFRD